VADDLTVVELLKRCSQRPADEGAWREFVRRYHSTIKGNVTKTFHQKVRSESERKQQFPEDLIDDLVQAVYARLVEDRTRALTRFVGAHENSIFQYLGMISINVVRDHFREAKAQKRPKIALSLEDLIENQGDASVPEALSQIDGRPSISESGFSVDEIEQALPRVVSGKHRDRDVLIFKLRYYEGLTFDEIKKVMGLELSPVSIGSILQRIVIKLKPLLIPPDARSDRSRAHSQS